MTASNCSPRLVGSVLILLIAASVGGCASTSAQSSSSSSTATSTSSAAETPAETPDEMTAATAAAAVDGTPVYVAVHPVQVVADRAVLTIDWSRPDTCTERSAVSVAALLDGVGGLAGLRMIADGEQWAPGVVTTTGALATTDTALEVLPNGSTTSSTYFAAPQTSMVDVLVPGIGTLSGVPVVAPAAADDLPSALVDLGEVTVPDPVPLS